MCSKTKDEVIKDLNKKKEKGEYLIIGSDNFWYGSGISSLKDAREEIENIKANPSEYGNPETHERQDSSPETFHIYKAILIEDI